MKYWVLRKDEVLGPYGPEELREHPHFGRGTQVFPAGRDIHKTKRRWVNAGDVPQLAVALNAREKKGATGSFLPPQPTILDLPVLGGILQKVEDLETEMIRLQMEADQRDIEIGSLKSRMAEKDREISGMRDALRDIEGRIGELDVLRRGVAELNAADGRKGAELAEIRSQISELAAGAEGTAATLETEAAARLSLEAEVREKLEELETKIPEPPPAEPLPPPPPKVRERLAAGFRTPTKKETAILAVPLLLLAGYLWNSSREKTAPSPIAESAPAPLSAKIPEPSPPPPTPAPPAPVRKARVRPTQKPAGPTQAEKDEKVRREIMNKVRLRMSGGALREGRKNLGSDAGAGAEPGDGTVSAEDLIPGLTEPGPAAPKPDKTLLPGLSPGALEKPSKESEQEALKLAKSFPVLGAYRPRCARSFSDLKKDWGGNRWKETKTLEEAVECWRYAAVMTAVAGVEAADGISRGKALKAVRKDIKRRGGLDELFAIEWRAVMLSPSTFGIAVKLEDKLNSAEPVIERFIVDAAARTLKPANFAAWREVDAGGHASWYAKNRKAPLDSDARGHSPTIRLDPDKPTK